MTHRKEIGILLGLSLAFSVLIFAAMLLLGSATEQKKAIDWVKHTRDVLAKISGVEADLIAASTERRAYIVSGEETFLRNHTNRLAEARRSLSQLHQLTSDNPRQTVACDRLQNLFDREATLSTKSVRLRHDNGYDAPSQTEFLNAEEVLIAGLHAVAAEMEKEENDRLRDRQSTLEKNIEGMKGFAVLLSITAFCLFIAIAFLFWRAARRTHLAEKALKLSNNELESRVLQKTSELQRAMEQSSWLASFPERNPNPIVEIGVDDNVLYYANPAATKQFTELHKKSADHPILAGLKDASIPLISGDVGLVRREVSIDGVCYFQTINFIPEGRRLRVYNSDITDRKRIQADLDLQNAELQLIFDTVPASIFYKDRNHRLLRINQEFCRLFEAAPERLLGKTDKELGSPYATQYFRDEDEVMLSGEAKRGIIEPIEINGETRWLLTNKIPYRNLNGKIVGVVGFAVDITERRFAEKRLEETMIREQELRITAQASENRFRTLVEESLIGIYLIQGDRFVYVNPAMEKIFGYSAHELTSAPVLQFVAPEDRSVVHENVRKRIQGAIRSVQYTLRIIRRDETIAHVEVRGGLSELNGNPAILGTLHDITDRIEAEKNILRLNAELESRVQERTAELESTNRELEAFSYSVSHDLRAPLRHIHGYVEMLKRATDGQLGEKPKRYLQTIADASSEMARLIDDLLAFSRVSRVELRQNPVSLRDLIEETIHGLEMEIKDRNIEWKIAEVPRVLGDRATLKQVIANLLGNAIKYSRTRNPAIIEVGTAGEKNLRTIFFVRDNGAGFDMEYANKLFGVFQRLHRSEDFEGTGIGLATVRRIIQRHGGETWAEGALEKGATFYFTLKQALPHDLP
jgi:PAS domain S-box-containing protein